MTLETFFKRFTLLPGFIQYGNDEPRPVDKAHYASRGVQKIPRGQHQGQEGGDDNSSQGKKYDRRNCRLLTSISPGEVHDAFKLYKNQLIPTSLAPLIAENHFYMLELWQREEGIPAAIFGRVKACIPTDGHLQNIREMELSFPQQGEKPEPVVLHPGDIRPQGHIQGYCVRVKVLGSSEDCADFERYERKFAEAGFALDFQAGYIDLLDLDELKRDSLPWFHVVGSRWFASIPLSWQDEIRSRLRRLSGWETLILNYHPSHTPVEVKKLSDELDYQHHITEFHLTDTRTPDQAYHIIKTIFEKVFTHPSSKASLLSNRQKRILE